MTHIIFGDTYDPGERDLYEDRVRTRQIQTAGGLDLVVAAVADGVGGRNKGEVAAQEAINALFACIERSQRKLVHEVLIEAVRSANRAVWHLQENGARSTLAVAAVYKGVLYIANVGDSRIYLCRNNKLTQLTIDHSFATIMPWRGQMSPAAANEHPRRDVLMFALGLKETVMVDIGFYVNTTDFTTANQRGPGGLPLKNGDSVLVCSDGLVKRSHKTNRAPVENTQIVQILREHEGVKAAKVLVGIASGNQAQDNVSVAVLQTPDRRRHLRALARTYALPVAIGVFLLASLLILFNSLGKVTGQKNALSAAMSGTDQAIAGRKTQVAAYTATPLPTHTPTATLRPTLASGEVGIRSGANQIDQIFSIGDDLINPTLNPTTVGSAPQDLFLYVYKDLYKDQPEKEHSALVMERAGSRVRFTAVEGQQIQFLAFPGSDLFIETGGYVNGARITLAQSRNSVVLTVAGSCLAVNFAQDDAAEAVTAACYEGSCTYSIQYTSPVTINAGKQVEIGLAGAGLRLKVSNIGALQAKAYSRSLPAGSSAQACALLFAPTPTPFIPTPTEKARSPRRAPTDTPIPPPLATATTAPSPLPVTATPLPSTPATSVPSATPPPATATTVPSATNPPPATATSVPSATNPPPPTATSAPSANATK